MPQSGNQLGQTTWICPRCNQVRVAMVKPVGPCPGDLFRGLIKAPAHSWEVRELGMNTKGTY